VAVYSSWHLLSGVSAIGTEMEWKSVVMPIILGFLITLVFMIFKNVGREKINEKFTKTP